LLLLLLNLVSLLVLMPLLLLFVLLLVLLLEKFGVGAAIPAAAGTTGCRFCCC
jgi:hypothetical protein